jgi:hypothetical protein
MNNQDLFEKYLINKNTKEQIQVPIKILEEDIKKKKGIVTTEEFDAVFGDILNEYKKQ